jgi:hypothetical protein
MVSSSFTPDKAEEMRAGIQSKVDSLIDDLEKLKGNEASHPLDLAENFSLPVAFKVGDWEKLLQGYSSPQNPM